MVIVSIGLILSFILGIISTIIVVRIRSTGVLMITHDPYDPSDGPYLSLKLENSTCYIQKKKYVTLKIENNYGLSQK